MNLCEIGLFAIVWGVSKVSWDNYHDLVNNVLCPKCIDNFNFFLKFVFKYLNLIY